MANYSFTINSLTYRETNGVISVEINVEGTADGYGAVLGTLIATPAGAASGTSKWAAVSYPEDGAQATGFGDGEWKIKGGDTWLTSGTVTLSNAGTVPMKGEMHLSARSWIGTFG